MKEKQPKVDETGRYVLIFVHSRGTPRTDRKGKPKEKMAYCRPWDVVVPISGTTAYPMRKQINDRILHPGDAMVMCETTFEHFRDESNELDISKWEELDREKYPDKNEGDIIQNYLDIPIAHDIPARSGMVPTEIRREINTL